MSDPAPTVGGDLGRMAIKLLHWTSALGFIAAILLPTGLGIYRLYAWLRTATWPTITNQAGLDMINRAPPHSSWAGVEWLIDWSVNAPLETGLAAAGATVWLLAKWLAEENWS